MAMPYTLWQIANLALLKQNPIAIIYHFSVCPFIELLHEASQFTDGTQREAFALPAGKFNSRLMLSSFKFFLAKVSSNKKQHMESENISFLSLFATKWRVEKC